MFKKLQKKWNVSTKQFWVIFIVFGLTGTTTALITRYATDILGMNENTFWVWKVLLKIIMMLFGYQALLLLYGFLFGQWKFFWKYEKKLLQKLKILKAERNEKETSPDNSVTSIKRIAIFASGTGTNAEKIITHFKNQSSITIQLIVTNNPNAGVLSIAQKFEIKTLVISKDRFFTDGYATELKNEQIDFIVLAGFLWKVPQVVINNFRNNIINIHPALLPKYGGKGMYGLKVHEAVIAAGEKHSGITIHYVDEHYDNGDNIFQATCDVLQTDTPATLAKKVHALEHKHFAIVIENLLTNYK